MKELGRYARRAMMVAKKHILLPQNCGNAFAGANWFRQVAGMLLLQRMPCRKFSAAFQAE
jgi:hypothetical protein